MPTNSYDCRRVIMVGCEEKPFVIGKLQGELGNQMFQVAATVSFALEHGFEAHFPDLAECREWNVPENHRHVFWRLSAHRPLREVSSIYEEGQGPFPIPGLPDTELVGFFQTEGYFEHHKREVAELLAPSEEILTYLKDKYRKPLRHPCTVATHVRTYRRDYGYFPKDDELHSFLGIQYYEEAVKVFPEESLFLVCSDDIEWCKEHMSHIAGDTVFVEGNSPYHDLYLMSLCHNNIIANSSFSWWAAYLNRNPGKIVVAPDRWYGEHWSHATDWIVPKAWLRVPRGSY